MVTSRLLYTGLLALLATERLLELRLSSRNAARILARRGVEVGHGHYLVMVDFHALFQIACAGEVWGLGRRFPGVLGWAALGVLTGAQGLRFWAISTLGERWSTRVIVLPGAAPVTGGPYRFLRHPNYVAVALEMAAVPLVHGAWLTALLFSAGNAALLAVRIPIEEAALGKLWVPRGQ